jgi:magnesium-transporting ATPase (P-type)
MSSGVEEVKVIREGKEMRVGSDELVVGDKVMIEQ